MADVSDSEFEELPECEPAWLRRHRATACRRRLLAAGYSPLPVNGKAPPIPGWQDTAATNDIISTWEDKYPDATNTGVLTSNTPAIDMDVSNSAVADEVQQIVERMIGFLLFGAVSRVLSVEFGSHQLDVTGAYRRAIGRTRERDRTGHT